MAHVVLFPLKKPNPLTEVLSVLALLTGSRARNTLVQSNRLAFYHYFTLRPLQELNCSALYNLMGHEERAMQLRLSKVPLLSICTHSSWPEQL